MEEQACILGVLDTTAAEVEGVVPPSAAITGTIGEVDVEGVLASTTSLTGTIGSTAIVGTLEDC
jgi:hypothetical protein